MKTHILSNRSAFRLSIVTDRVAKYLTGVFPPVLALVAVYLEPTISAWAKGRTTALPLATLLLLSILLHPRLRYLLMITLCYGVSFLALRDILHSREVGLPVPLNFVEWEVVKVIDLLMIAGLSAISAVTETVRPGTVWARRCYFVAAGLYFFGMGLVSYFRISNWQSILLMVTGVTSLVGCLFAHRIVATEAEEEWEDGPTDEMLQQAREAAHHAALQAKEWQENLISVMDERDTTNRQFTNG